MQIDEPPTTMPGGAIKSMVHQLINKLMGTIKVIIETPSSPGPAAAVEGSLLQMLSPLMVA
jgi:E3 ubiquitin-protein ligase HUWE1